MNLENTIQNNYKQQKSGANKQLLYWAGLNMMMYLSISNLAPTHTNLTRARQTIYSISQQATDKNQAYILSNWGAFFGSIKLLTKHNIKY